MAQSVMKGTMTLTAASLATRMMGLAYRVYLVRLAGPQVIGLFQMIFPLYFTLMVLSSAGIPLAVSKMVADREALGKEASIRRLMGMAIWLTLGMGLAVALILFVSAGTLSNRILRDGRTLLPLLVIAPGLPAMGLAGTLKGYFQGRGQMWPVGAGQVVEQVIHIGVTLGLLFTFPMANDALTAALLAGGSLAGDLVGTAFIGVCYRADARRRGAGPGSVEPLGRLFRELVGLAVPVTAGRLVVSINSAVNATLIPNLLKAGGMSVHQATASFGELTGMAMNLLTIPTVFTASMAMSMIPGVAGAQSTGDTRGMSRNAWQGLKSALIIGFLFAALFLALGVPMCETFFESGSAGFLLMALAPGGLALYCQHVTTGILQGLRKPSVPMFCSLVATAFSTVCLLVLIKVMGMGIMGAAISISMAMCLGAILSLIFVMRDTRLPYLPSAFVRLAACSVVTGAAARWAWALAGPGIVGLVMGCIAGTLVYLGSILGLGVISVSLIPRIFKRISGKKGQ